MEEIDEERYKTMLAKEVVLINWVSFSFVLGISIEVSGVIFWLLFF